MQTNEMFAFWRGGATERVRDGFIKNKLAIQRSDCRFERRKTFAVEMDAPARSSDIQRSFLSGAGGGTRTHTPLRITDFESVSSANSDTPAFIFLSRLPMSCPRNRRDIVEGH